MKEIAKKIIQEELHKRGVEVKKIILFGSRARGDYDKNSDWDFFVIIDKTLNRDEKWEIILEIKRKLAKLKIPNDIFIKSLKEVKDEQYDVGYLTYYALKEGIEI
jgi:predicted nucleotidyltransferase